MADKIAEKTARKVALIRTAKGVLPTTFPMDQWEILDKRNPAAAQFNVPWVVSLEEDPRGVLITYEVIDKVSKAPVVLQSLVPWANLAEVRYAQ